MNRILVSPLPLGYLTTAADGEIVKERGVTFELTFVSRRFDSIIAEGKKRVDEKTVVLDKFEEYETLLEVVNQIGEAVGDVCVLAAFFVSVSDFPKLHPAVKAVKSALNIFVKVRNFHYSECR